MKVLEQGKGWSKRLVCRGCQSKLEIEPDDLEYEVTAADAARDQYKEEVQGTFYVICPLEECGLRLEIKSKDVSTSVANKVKNK